MTNVVHKNVEVDTMYKRLDISESYLLKLRVPVENSIFSQEYEVLISSTKFLEDLKDLVEGKRERCYFAHGMTNIDFYKIGKRFALTHSPDTGCNTQLILKNGEMKRIMNHLEHAK